MKKLKGFEGFRHLLPMVIPILVGMLAAFFIFDFLNSYEKGFATYIIVVMGFAILCQLIYFKIKKWL